MKTALTKSQASTTEPERATASDGPIRHWWSVIPALAALLGVAIWRLDRQSLWVDEVFSLAATNDLGLSLRSTKGTMAGYYIVLWLWARVSTAAWWLRAFSTVGAAVTLVLIAAIARRLHPPRVAWIAPLLVVGIPIFAWTATEARSYAWETALVAGCWWLIVRGVQAYERREAHQARWWVALAIGCAIGPVIHGLFIVQVPGFLVVAFLKRNAWHAMLRRILPSVFTAVVPTFLIYQAGGSSMGASWAYDLGARLGVLPTWFLGPRAWIAVLVGLAALGGAAVCIAGAVRSRSLLERTRSLLPLLWGGLGLLCALVIAQIAGPFAPYYMASCAAGIALLAAEALAWLWRGGSIGTRAVRRTFGIAAVVVLLGSLAFGAVRHPITYHENWRGAAKVVARAAEPGDAIVFVGTSSYTFSSSSGLLGFTAAWRDVPHRVNPTVISHDRQLDQGVIRTVSFEGVHRIQRAWLRRDRVWLVTYQHVLEPDRLFGADIPRDYCVRQSTHFDPEINVYLYVRRVHGQSCTSH